MSDNETENSFGNSITSEELTPQVTAVFEPSSRQLELLCKLMKKFMDE